MNDEQYMRRALELSLKGCPSPNPYVGAVLVKDGKIISEGYHRRVGQPHAEIEALAGVEAEGATLYVTLEPCSHRGRTPPCTDAILSCGVSEVVYAVDDPTKKVRGRQILEDAGLKVTSGVLEAQARKVNEAFFKYSTTGLPFICLKVASTLDAMIAASNGQSKWITSEKSRDCVQNLRARYDAVLVGVSTVLADDPRLDVRGGMGPNPLRVVLDSELRTPPDARVLVDSNALIGTTEKAKEEDIRKYCKLCSVEVLGEDEVDIGRLLEHLGLLGVTSVLVEGGSKVNYSFVKGGYFDKMLWFIAPKLLPGNNLGAIQGTPSKSLSEAVNIRFDEVTNLGDDLLITCYPR